MAPWPGDMGRRRDRGGPSHRQDMGHHALGRAVVRSLAVRWWLGSGSVDAVSTSGAGSSHRARRRRWSPTKEAARRGIGEGSTVRWRPTEEAAPVDSAPRNSVRLSLVEAVSGMAMAHWGGATQNESRRKGWCDSY
jgi:hypothetical protein